MKIIYVENVRIPSERAHAYQIVQTCAWFARSGHDVVLVNPNRAGGKNVFQAYDLASDLFHHTRLDVTDPLSWSWFPSKKVAYALQRFSFARAITRWARDRKADIWYTRDPAMVDILRDRERRFVLELHDRPDAQPARWERIKPFVSAYVVITKGLKDVLVSLGIDAARIHVAPDGYDPKDFALSADRTNERERLGVPRDAFVVMYAGSFYPWKGVDLVVRAWPKTDANAHLVLIGGPQEDRDRLERLANAHPRIHLHPAVAHDQAVRSFVAADVGLLSSSDAHEIGRVFTSPLKQFEYLAAGLPVLASDVPSSHEILHDDVAKFYAYTENGFAAALHEAMRDPAWRERASRVAQDVVKPYTWEARAQGIMQHLV